MSMIIKRRLFLTAAGAIVIQYPRNLSAQEKTIKGAGSSFAASVTRDWIAESKQSLGWNVEYSPSGSGDGRNRISAGDVDFALSDEPMAENLLTQGGLIQFPVLFGGITPVVNLPGISSGQLQLTAQLLGALYTGKIKKWNDAAIAAANPGIKLPDQDVAPVFQATPNGPPSGTTFTFSRYLLLTNADWRERHGEKITKRWAVGSMVATQNDMVETMKVLPGSLGYASFGYAAAKGLTTVRLTNKAGKVVAPSAEALRATASRIDWSTQAALAPELIDLPGDGSWPITVSTYALVPRTPAQKDRGEAVRAFLGYVVTNGEAAANKMTASALPAAARELVLRTLQYAAG